MSFTLALAVIVVSQTYQPSMPVEIYIAPIVAPSNIVGMGGAAQALATGSGAILQNPAAMAVRYDYNGNRSFDWDFSFDTLLSVGNIDVENSGRNDDGEHMQLIEASLGFNIKRFAVALGFDIQNVRSCAFNAASCSEANTFQVKTTLGVLAASYAFLNGDLVAGASIIVPQASFQVGDESNQPSYNGNAVSFGVVVRPHGQPLRFGSTLRLRTHASRSGGGDNTQVGDRFIPDHLEAPWQLSAGLAWSFGDKPLNLRDSYGDNRVEGESVDPLRRSYLVVAGDVVLIGPGGGAVGRGAWLDQSEQIAGRATSVSVRLGAESEFWQDVMRVRTGTYWEPSRFDNSSGRAHITAGFDLRLFQLIWVWRLTGSIDLARDYRNLGVSLGFWH